MEIVARAGQRIAFERSGSGPAVLLQHGLMSRRATWRDNGFVAALAREFTVLAVDSLGHGDSDKPAEPERYRGEARAADLAAVLDACGAARAHLVGYSMGGWMAVAFATHHPERLRSLTLGGWDPVGGRSVPLPFEAVLAGVRARAPQLAAWMTPDAEPGLRACWDALDDTAGAEAALAACPAPLLLWAGRDDPAHDAMAALAARLPRARFRAVGGDHLGAMTTHATESLAALQQHLRAAG